MNKDQLPEYCTLGDVAKALGVTKERARQIEASALRKLRSILKKRGLELEDLLPDDHQWSGSGRKVPPEKD